MSDSELDPNEGFLNHATFAHNMVQQNTLGNSFLTMPLAGSKHAPKKFTGKYKQIQDFIDHYNLLLAQHNILSDTKKCDLITRYTSSKVEAFIKALPNYTKHNWNELQKDLLKYYDADLDTKKYKIHDLAKLVKACRDRRVKNLSSWREYGRKFITVAGWLLNKGRITDSEYATFYWNGIPKALRRKLENRLLARSPTRSLSEPFEVQEINEAAEAVLQRDRFDAHYEDSDPDTGSDSEDSDEDTDSSDSDSEDDLRRMRRRIKKKARYSKGKLRASVSDSDSESSEEEASTYKKRHSKSKKKVGSKTEPEIDAIIKELNSMSISDPAYAALVFKGMKLDANILQVVRAPAFNEHPVSPSGPYYPRQNNSFRPQRSPHMNSNFTPQRQWNNAPPPMPPRQFNNNSMPPRQFNNNSMPPRQFNNSSIPTHQVHNAVPSYQSEMCYGCNQPGHMISRCPGLNDMINKGLISRSDQDYKWRTTDGTIIRRQPQESLTEACNRVIAESGSAPVSHLIRVMDPDDINGDMARDAYDQAFYCEPNYSDSSSETSEDLRDFHSYSDEEGTPITAYIHEDDSDCDANQVRRFAFPVEPAEKTSKIRRKEVMDGIYMPARKPAPPKPSNNKENVEMTPIAPATRSRTRAPQPAPVKEIKATSRPPPQPLPLPAKQTAIKEKKLVPIDVRAPEFDGRRDEMIVDDHPTTKRDGGNQPLIKNVSNRQPQPPNASEEVVKNKEAFEKRPPLIRQSEIAMHTKPMSILNQMLNTRVDLAIGEVLGISKELSGMFNDKIKFKTPPKPIAPVITSFPVKATTFHAKNSALLIKIEMHVSGRPVVAIIDTGSMLNIVKRSICNEIIGRPIDYSKKITISDANGGSGILHGLVANVPLGCGEVYTKANLYVGEDSPFDLLLGRPWQRSNLIGIDEQLEGTYIIFKDPHTHEPRFKVLAVPDESGGLEYDGAEWAAPIPASLMITAASCSSEESDSRMVIEDAGQDSYSATDVEVPQHDTVCHQQPTASSAFAGPSFQLEGPDKKSKIHPRMAALLAGQIENAPEYINSLEAQFNFPHLPSAIDCSQSMNTEARILRTIPNAKIDPVEPGRSTPQRLQSEIISAAIGDTNFLRRNGFLNDLILSTTEGFQLGPGSEPNGRTFTDFIFLNAGLINVTPGRGTTVKTHAFVRIYSATDIPIPSSWLLPYLGRPLPQNEVSYRKIKSEERKLTRIQTHFTNTPIDLPEMAPQRTRHQDSASGNRVRVLLKSPVPVSFQAPSKASQIKLASSQTRATAPSTKSGTTETDSETSSPPTGKSTRRSHRLATKALIAWGPCTPPGSPPTKRRHRQSPMPALEESDSEDPEDAMQDESYEAEEQDEEIDELKDDMEIDREWEEECEAIAEEIEEENRNGEPPSRNNTTHRYHDMFRFLTGTDPTDDISDLLREAAATEVPHRTTPEPQTSTTIPDRVSSPQFADLNLLMHFAHQAKNQPVNINKTALRHLLTAPEIPKQIPVYHIRVANRQLQPQTNTTGDSMPDLVSDRSTSDTDSTSLSASNQHTRRNGPTLPGFSSEVTAAELQPQVTASSADRTSSPGDSTLVQTAPSSPTFHQRVDPFGRARLVNRAELLDRLDADVNRVQTLIGDARRDEEPGLELYQDRLRETRVRIENLSPEQIGMLPVARIFLLGLITLLNAKDRSKNPTTNDAAIQRPERPPVPPFRIATPRPPISLPPPRPVPMDIDSESTSPPGHPIPLPTVRIPSGFTPPIRRGSDDTSPNPQFRFRYDPESSQSPAPSANVEDPALTHNLDINAGFRTIRDQSGHADLEPPPLCPSVINDGDPNVPPAYSPVPSPELRDRPSSRSASPPTIPQCQSRPPNISDPRNTPISERAWYEGGANDYDREAATIVCPLYFDTRNNSLVENVSEVPTQYVKVYTQLGGILHPLILTSRPYALFHYPISIPRSHSTTFGERVLELAFLRQEIEMLIQRTQDALSDAEKAEATLSYIYMLRRWPSTTSDTLIRVRLDRIYVLSHMHPVYNPLVKPSEAAFLRTAATILAERGRHIHADHIDRVLRTPHWDDWEVRELVCLGALESKHRHGEALEYFRRVDDQHWGIHQVEAEDRVDLERLLPDRDSDA